MPVDVQALVVPAPAAPASAPAAATSAAGCSTPIPTAAATAVQTAPDLPAGVHLHWAVPDGLTGGRPGAIRAHEASDLQLRPLPDRWLVCRLSPAAAGQGPPDSRAWIVESDRAPLRCPLESWDPAAPAGRRRRAARARHSSPRRRAATSGWAGVYDNVRDRLAFHDDLADLGGAAATLAYVVVGWYADASARPAAPADRPEQLHRAAGRPRLGRRPELAARGRGPTSRSSTSTWRPSPALAGHARAGDRPDHRPHADHRGEIGPAIDRRSAAERETSVVLGIDDFVLDPERARFVTSRRQPRVTASLYHGTIYGVDAGGGGVDAAPGGRAPSR